MFFAYTLQAGVWLFRRRPWARSRVKGGVIKRCPQLAGTRRHRLQLTDRRRKLWMGE